MTTSHFKTICKFVKTIGQFEQFFFVKKTAIVRNLVLGEKVAIQLGFKRRTPEFRSDVPTTTLLGTQNLPFSQSRPLYLYECIECLNKFSVRVLCHKLCLFSSVKFVYKTNSTNFEIEQSIRKLSVLWQM